MRPTKRIDAFLNILKKEWKKNPDLRFTQFLYGHGLVNTSFDFGVEENDLLERMFPNVHPSEYLLWGNKGKDGNSKTKFKVINTMDTNHIMNVLATQNPSPKMKQALIYVLESRGFSVNYLSKID